MKPRSATHSARRASVQFTAEDAEAAKGRRGVPWPATPQTAVVRQTRLPVGPIRHRESDPA